jgi:uncharacterized protein YndB with AHSA1/START domain
MTTPIDPDRDLSISRVINATRAAIWDAWTNPAKFEQWWVPAPTICKVLAMDLRPGGSFLTEISEDGGDFVPHITGCFLAVDELERIVFTDTLVANWRPSAHPFMTAIITLGDHPDGTEYVARAVHGSAADRNTHAESGFHDGWGTVTKQLAQLVEGAK